MKSFHANISVFVPHMGCEHQCVFCNQRVISGCLEIPDGDTVKNAVETAKKSSKYNPKNTEIAFFGGSFTAIKREYMISLLEAAYKYVSDGTVKGIRISTRPDAINPEVLEILKRYGVTAIELGAQSMNDNVLIACERGHTSADVVRASKMIKDYGFELGLQMMTGLPADTYETAIDTAHRIISLRPDTVRIYPTIVLEGTKLAYMFKNQEYIPQTLEEAIELVSRLLVLFRQQNISVIRTGLHTIDETKYVAGPWHPAFRELCDSRIYLRQILNKVKEKGNYEISVSPKEISKAIGQKRSNIDLLKEQGINCTINSDKNLKEYEMIIKKV